MENPYYIDPLEEYVRLAEHLGSQQERTIRKKKQLLENYHKYKGNVQRACKATGISRKTFYNWQNSDTYYKQVLEIAFSVYDPSEHTETPIDMIMQGGSRAALRFLKKNHPKYKRIRPRGRESMSDPYKRDDHGRFEKGE